MADVVSGDQFAAVSGFAGIGRRLCRWCGGDSGCARVTFWGALAMALTAGVGALFGVAA
jgi:hypothetical protein